MNQEPEDSIAVYLSKARRGSESAATNLWNRYFSRLAALAEKRLGGILNVYSGEDIAVSALRSVLVGIRDGKYPDLTSEGLWHLLVRITANKTTCLLYTSPSPRDRTRSRMPSSA